MWRLCRYVALIMLMVIGPFVDAPALTRAQSSTEPSPQPLRLMTQGFGQDGRWLGIGFVVENPNASTAIQNAPYQIAVYDAAGSVITTHSGWVWMVYPGQRLGVAERIVLPEGARAARADVQVAAGRFVANSGPPPLSAGDVTYRPDRFFPKVTGVVRSSYPQTVTYVTVYAVGFDVDGAPVGGGSGIIQFIPANGQAAAEIYVTFGSRPARIELFPTLTILSQMQ